MDEPTPPADPLKRLFDRAAPALRAIDRTINDHEALRAHRDSLVDRAAELLKGSGPDTDVEGVVVDRESPLQTGEPGAAAPQAAAHVAPSTGPKAHFDAQRLRRMAAAAGREAVRPATTRAPAPTVAWVLGPLLALLVLWRIVVRSRR